MKVSVGKTSACFVVFVVVDDVVVVAATFCVFPLSHFALMEKEKLKEEGLGGKSRRKKWKDRDCC